VGYHPFHKKQIYNFQLNRWHSIGFARLEDMEEAGRQVKSFKDWKEVMVKLGDKALKEGRLLNAAIYYRSAEFYIIKKNEEKENLYDKFTGLFYRVVENEPFEQHKVPYGDAFLPAIKFPSLGGKAKGTIVMHGGFDSFLEEWYFMIRYLAQKDFDVIAFEGPGQGGALKKYSVPFRINWEKPVGAVLDYFKLDDVTLFGLSMGGWYCLRAAAFEPRVKRVIPSGHSIDYLRNYGKIIKAMHLFFLKRFRDYTNKMCLKSMEKEKGLEAWMIGNLMYITQAKTPLEALEIWLSLNTGNIHSELVKQDVLYLLGRNDHFIPFKMFQVQIDALKNARSVTGRVFTKEEHAHNHCQIGNIKLSLDVIIDWINKKTAR
jgi:pimeloyl-ACP methyl ester carboxylesterase